jgi:nucleoside-diphosphate-sugar epimerase
MDGFKGKKVLVTGGAGFIGSHIVEGLVASGARVVVLDDLSSGKLGNLDAVCDDVSLVEGDLRDERKLDKALDGVDLVCHQAALRSVPKSVNDPAKYNDVNVTGTLKLFIKARDKGIKRIVCASSSSVYGEREDMPERETDMPLPISPYAATKLIVEHYSHVFCKMYDMEIVNLRYFNVFGPRQSLEDEYAVVVPKFAVSLLKGVQPPIYGDGEQERDFTYVGNVADMNLRCMVADGVAGEVFNVGNGKPHSVNELFNILRDITGADVAAEYKPLRKGDVRRTHADIAKAKKLAGWEPEVDFRAGLEKTVEYFRSQQ